MNGITYETFTYICYGTAALSAVLLATSVILFFVLKIPNVIGDLTGANARKAIAQIRNQNEATGEKTYQPSVVNRERGKITDKISGSGRLLRQRTSNLAGHGTTKLNTAELSEMALADQPIPVPEAYVPDQTTVLDQTMPQTTVLSHAMPETTVLSQGPSETTVLDQEQLAVDAQVRAQTVFTVDFEITFIHTNERIS